jgi:ketosteroid isomerase-like protein
MKRSVFLLAILAILVMPTGAAFGMAAGQVPQNLEKLCELAALKDPYILGTICMSQPIAPGPATASASAASDAVQPKAEIPSESVVTASVDLATISDPAERRAAEEFLATALAKERAFFYDGDVEGVLSYYADDIISVRPELEEMVGKEALAQDVRPFLENNKVVGNLTIKRIWLDGDRATRLAKWEGWATPKDGGPGARFIGRCLLNWEKIDGEWKVVSEFINFLVPPTAIE